MIYFLRCLYFTTAKLINKPINAPNKKPKRAIQNKPRTILESNNLIGSDSKKNIRTDTSGFSTKVDSSGNPAIKFWNEKPSIIPTIPPIIKYLKSIFSFILSIILHIKLFYYLNLLNVENKKLEGGKMQGKLFF